MWIIPDFKSFTAPVTDDKQFTSSLIFRTPSKLKINASLNSTRKDSGMITAILSSFNFCIQNWLYAPPPVTSSFLFSPKIVFIEFAKW